jgi:hypothetical protein
MSKPNGLRVKSTSWTPSLIKAAWHPMGAGFGSAGEQLIDQLACPAGQYSVPAFRATRCSTPADKLDKVQTTFANGRH